MTTKEVLSRVPSFPNIEAVRLAQQSKRELREADLYPRDGSRELFQLERDIAGIMGVRQGNLLLYNTGMLAVTDALEISRPTVGTRILRGYQQYSQAGNYISDDLRSRGALIFQADPGSIEDISRALEVRKPEIIFFETVTNGSEMAVLNVEEFLRLPVLQELDPLIILDNTLPTSTAMPLGEAMAVSGRRIIGVESGTKFIGLNREMCGMAYTLNQGLLLSLKERRQRTGSLLSVSAVETIRDCMPKTAEDYHSRNSAIFRHTLRLARACNIPAIIHPNLPTHPNSPYANSCSPEGISPVFFIVPEGSGENDFKIDEKLWENPVISSLCDLGQSFGFNRVRIWPDEIAPVVRISGGIYSPEEEMALNQAFAETLAFLGLVDA